MPPALSPDRWDLLWQGVLSSKRYARSRKKKFRKREQTQQYFAFLPLSSNLHLSLKYLGTGQAEWTFETPVLSVVYYRYLRFYEDGTAVWAMSFDAPVRPKPEQGDLSLLDLVKPDGLSGHVSQLKQGRRMTIHSGVYSVFPFGENRDEITVAVRGHPNSTFMLTMRLHRSKRKHLLQWLSYCDQPDAPHRERTWFNTACNDLPVLQFLAYHRLK